MNTSNEKEAQKLELDKLEKLAKEFFKWELDLVKNELDGDLSDVGHTKWACDLVSSDFYSNCEAALKRYALNGDVIAIGFVCLCRTIRSLVK